MVFEMIVGLPGAPGATVSGVVTEIWLERLERLPAPSYARTLYKYVTPGLAVWSEKLVDDDVPIGVPPLFRKIS